MRNEVNRIMADYTELAGDDEYDDVILDKDMSETAPLAA